MSPVSTTSESNTAQLERLTRTSSSMLWAAYADALGFISELASAGALKTRTHGRALTETFAWHRRVGGKFGVQIELPAGCYSDDTQLRLAVSRSISNGGFDVEAFARVELTVWPAYALGGGRASRAAAANMSRPNATWSTNFYPGWTESGGNGAAMRIQPHVWASTDLSGVGYLEDVIRDAVVTHGHPRALVGAVMHALSLGFAMHTGRTPRVDGWRRILELTRHAISVFSRDPQLSTYWVPRWEVETKKKFETEWYAAVDECALMLNRVEPLVEEVALFAEDPERRRGSAAYRSAGEMLGLRASGTVGSATATVVASMLLAAAFPDDPRNAAILSASALGTDTDTIGTMAAAVIGAAAPDEPTESIQDRDYLSDEAIRLCQIGARQPAARFSYPDILRWSPPKTQLDVVGNADGRAALAGLGWIEFTGASQATGDAEWSWVKTSFGPTVVIKHRFDLPELPPENWPRVKGSAASTAPLSSRWRKSNDSRPAPANEQPQLYDDADTVSPANSNPVEGLDIDVVIGALERANYTDPSIGRAVRVVARDGSVEQLLALVASIREPLRQPRNSG